MKKKMRKREKREVVNSEFTIIGRKSITHTKKFGKRCVKHWNFTKHINHNAIAFELKHKNQRYLAIVRLFAK